MGGEDGLNYSGVSKILSTAVGWILIAVSATELLASSGFA